MAAVGSVLTVGANVFPLVRLPRDVLNLVFSSLHSADRVALRFVKPFRDLPSITQPVVLRRVLGDFMRHGHSEQYLVWLTSSLRIPPRRELCDGAAGFGHLNALKWMHSHRYPWGPTTCAAAARGGHLEVLQWLFDNKCGWLDTTVGSAAEAGHMKVVQWAVEHGCRPTTLSLNMAVRGGNKEIVQWLLGRGCKPDDTTQSYAVAAGNLQLLKWMRTDTTFNHLMNISNVCTAAITWGQFDIIDWALEIIPGESMTVPSRELMMAAAARCSLACVKYMHDKGFPIPSAMAHVAADCGNIEVLEWLQEHKLPFTAQVIEAAAKHGHVKALDWLMAAGCPHDDTLVKAAAEYDLALIKHLHTKYGISPTLAQFYYATTMGKLPMLEWLVSIDCIPKTDQEKQRCPRPYHPAVKAYLIKLGVKDAEKLAREEALDADEY